MRWCQLGLALLLFGLPCSAGADADLDRARALALQGKHGLAREAARKVLRRNLNDPEALQLVVATSCELGDEAVARLAYKRLAPDVQSMAARHCLRRGIRLTGAPSRARPTRTRPTRTRPTRTRPTQAAPKEAAPKEAAPKEAAPKEAAPKEATPKEATRVEAAPSSRLSWRVTFWSVLSVSVATLVGAAVVTTSYESLEDDKEDAILAYRKATGETTFGSSDDVCAEAAGRVGTETILAICEDANSRATTAGVLFGVSIAFAAFSGYLYYRAYIKKEDPLPKVSLSPTVSPTSGGLSLRLTF